MEAQVTNINCNVSLFMKILTNKLRLFGDGGSNTKACLERKLGNQEEPKESKNPEKEQMSFSAMNHSKSLLKREEKVYIKPYQGDINALKLNHWLQDLDVYFSVYNIEEEIKISCAYLKLKDHVLIWWKIHKETLKLEGYPPIIKWEDFKTLMKSC